MLKNLDSLYIGFLLMLIASIFVSSLIKRKTNNLSRYFYGDRNLKPNSVAQLFLSTAFSMNGMMYQIWLGYRIGWYGLLVQVVWCACYIWMAKYSKRIQTLSKNGDTLHGIIAKYFGYKTGQIAAFITILSMILQSSWEFIVGVSVFSDNVAIQTVFIFLIAIIGAFYTVMGGLRGNLYANIFQNIVAMIGFSVVFIVLTCCFHPIHNFNTTSPKLILELGGIGAIISNIVLSIFFQFGDMSAWQNLSSVNKDETSRKRTLWISAFWVLIFPGLIGTLIGLAFKDNSLSNLSGIGVITSDNVFIHILSLIRKISPSLILLISAGFAGAMLSTIDGLFLVCGLAMVADISKKYKSYVKEAMHKESLDDNTDFSQHEMEISAVDYARKWIMLLAVISPLMIFAFIRISGISIFDLVYVAFLVPMTLIPVVFKLLSTKNEGLKSFGWQSIVSGFIAGIVFVIIGLVFKNFLIFGSNLLLWSPTASLMVSFSFYYLFERNTVNG